MILRFKGNSHFYFTDDEIHVLVNKKHYCLRGDIEHYNIIESIIALADGTRTDQEILKAFNRDNILYVKSIINNFIRMGIIGYVEERFISTEDQLYKILNREINLENNYFEDHYIIYCDTSSEIYDLLQVTLEQLQSKEFIELKDFRSHTPEKNSLLIVDNEKFDKNRALYKNIKDKVIMIWNDGVILKAGFMEQFLADSKNSLVEEKINNLSCLQSKVLVIELLMYILDVFIKRDDHKVVISVDESLQLKYS